VTFIDVQQNSEEWDLLRVGKITSSNLGIVMANYGKAFGDPAKKYAVEIALEQITGIPAGGGYSNGHMDRGHEDEPVARMLYEEQYFCDVTNGGFYDLGDYGCSPDGHVNHNGLVEIKSALPHIHYERIRKQSCNSATYRWQMIGNLKAADKEWIDFISYCGSFPEDKRLYVIRHKAEDFANEFKMIDERLGQFRELIAEAKRTILNSEYFLTTSKAA
jgi:hypothetical protein